MDLPSVYRRVGNHIAYQIGVIMHHHPLSVREPHPGPVSHLAGQVMMYTIYGGLVVACAYGTLRERILARTGRNL